MPFDALQHQDDEALFAPRLSVVELQMPFDDTLAIDAVRELLSYDPITGTFHWLQDVAKNVKAGSVAGSTKVLRTGTTGKVARYRYIKIGGRDVVAARLAWLLHYGAWPVNRLRFKDGDALNLMIDNLYESNGLPISYDQSEPGQRAEYLRAHRAAHPLAWKGTALKQAFNIDLADYNRLIAAQNNRCAICNQEETERRNGKLKTLSVDHDHETGAIRALLCTACNKMIGLSREDCDTLRRGADYLEKHAQTTANVVTIKRPTDGR